MRRINIENFIGKKVSLFGAKDSKLTVFKKDDRKDYWICRCECGNYISVKKSDLIRKDTKGTRSCGCMRKEVSKKFCLLHKHDLSGKKFGKLTALFLSKEREKNGGTKWECRCECGSYTTVSTSNLLEGRTKSCGCLQSNGEETIAKWLTDNKILFKRQFTFDNCKRKQKLRFDFAVFIENKILLVEFQGIQHFDKTNKWYTDYMAENDNIKKSFCRANNIQLLELFPKEDYIKRLKDTIDNIKKQ